MTVQANLYIIVEGPMDAHLIRAILGKDLAARLRFFAAGGRVSLATVGRNILVHEGGPVLLVMDSDTRNPRLVEELQAMALTAMSGVLPPSFHRASEWVQVFSFIPEIEVIFFETPKVLEALLGKKLPEEAVQEGLLAPKATLGRLLDEGKVTYEKLVASLSPQTAGILAAGQQAQALKAAIESMMTPAVNV